MGSTGSTTGSTGSGSTMGSTGSTNMANNSTGMGADANTTSGTAVDNSNIFMAVNGNPFAMPKLNMFIENGSFTGYTGHNNIMGTIKVEGNTLHFNELMPSTNIQSHGGFDQAAYLDRLRRADSYDVTNNQLRLKQGDQVLLVFGKSTK
ncbi:META domain-containing protein [Segetibacter sp. 3557_3]|nr:META domain-containing protein [Segetibacter sp. 3557_3]